MPCFCSQHNFLLPALQKWQSGFWSLCILLSITCPNCPCTQLFLVPYSVFVFCAGGDVCPGAGTAARGPWRRRLSRCRHCSKGPQVPACLLATLTPELEGPGGKAQRAGQLQTSTAAGLCPVRRAAPCLPLLFPPLLVAQVEMLEPLDEAAGSREEGGTPATPRARPHPWATATQNQAWRTGVPYGGWAVAGAVGA